MIPRPFEEISHTADMGIRAFGVCLDEVLRNAAEGMFSLVLSDQPSDAATGKKTLRLEAASGEMLLHAWLSELLFLHAVGKILPVRYQLSAKWENPGQAENGPVAEATTCVPAGNEAETTTGHISQPAALWQLKAEITFAEMTRATAIQATEIKAVTWHGLSLRFDADLWCAEVIFDT